MGILNVTPNSFSDGGQYDTLSKATERASQLIEQGADLIDIGGESTRPGAEPVSTDEELKRVIPVIESLRATSDILISIDTSKAAVMREAIRAGASIVNDVTGLQDEQALSVVAEHHVFACLMHMQGCPKTMQDNPVYAKDVVEEINAYFETRIKACLQAGIMKDKLILDPGFGFGKTVRHNLQLTRQLKQFHRHGLPILLGFSRKSTIGTVLNQPVTQRVLGGVVLSVYAALQGVSMIRTHEVDETRQALMMLSAIENTRYEE